MKPGPRCTVCSHPKRREVERDVLATEGKLSDRAISVKYGLSRTSIQRHKDAHIKRAVEKALEKVEKAEIQAGASSLEQAETLVLRAMEILSVAEVRDGDGRLTRATDVKAAMAALGGAAKAIGLQAQLRGEIQTGTTVQLLVDARGQPRPEWLAIEGAILAALRPYPEAADAVARALAGLGEPAPLLTAGAG